MTSPGVHTTYSPDPALALAGILCCQHCGQLPEAHRPDQRCYTRDEMAAQLHFWRQHGRWPQPGEACPDAPAPPPRHVSPAVVLAIACPHCFRLSRVRWYDGVPVLTPSCEGCGQDWSGAERQALVAQLEAAQAARAGEKSPGAGGNVREGNAASEVPKKEAV